MGYYCKICNCYDCKKHTFLLSKYKKIDHFAGSSPPEIFVGRYGYPNVNIGILSPEEKGDTSHLSSPEEWFKNDYNIPKIVALRNSLIYGRAKSNIKEIETNNSLKKIMQEVARTHKSIATEFYLKSPILPNKENENYLPIIKNSAIIKKIVLRENPIIKPKVEYLSADTDAKSQTAIIELEKYADTNHIIKILSAGLLGRKLFRKLVPTRWAITAVDSTLSKNKLKKIRYYKEISEIMVFNSEYLGNHYEFILLPSSWEFEVIEISLKNKGVWQDYESLFNRKDYASSVTGAYYVNRLAVTEYLEKIQRQASCLVLREILPSYDVPLGVGILRETSRQALNQKPKIFESIKEAIKDIQTRIHQPIENYTSKSKIMKNYNKQSKLNNFLST